VCFNLGFWATVRASNNAVLKASSKCAFCVAAQITTAVDVDSVFFSKNTILCNYAPHFQKKAKEHSFMTIRKLIIKAKLRLIENQHQYLFVYHCSGLTTTQWQQLRNLLYLDTAVFPLQNKSTFGRNSNGVFKANKCDYLPGPICVFYFTKTHHELSYKYDKSSGCVFSSSAAVRKSTQLSELSSCKKKRDKNIDVFKCVSELLAKISSLGYNSNLVLLYAKTKSTLMNHIDIKEAMSLQTVSVYEQLLCTISTPMHSLCVLFEYKLENNCS
jgi:hypothetical protein